MVRLKKRWIIGVVVLILLLLGSGIFFSYQSRPEFTGPVEVQAQTTEEIYQIGDEMILNLTVLTEPDYTVQFPELTPPEGLELVRQEDSSLKKIWGVFKHSISYHFTSFEPGEYIFPEFVIPYTSPEGENHELKVDGPIILVESVLGSNPTDIRALKPLADVPQNPLVYYLIAGVLLLVGIIAAIWWFWRKRKRGSAIPEELPLPAHVVAYHRLAWLSTSELIEDGQIDQYFTILTEIVREYIENRFRVKAMEMTTQEFFEQSLRKLNLYPNQQEVLREFLQSADLVKYARHIPGYEQIHQAYETAKRFVDETKIVREEGGEEVV